MTVEEAGEIIIIVLAAHRHQHSSNSSSRIITQPIHSNLCHRPNNRVDSILSTALLPLSNLLLANMAVLQHSTQEVSLLIMALHCLRGTSRLTKEVMHPLQRIILPICRQIILRRHSNSSLTILSNLLLIIDKTARKRMILIHCSRLFCFVSDIYTLQSID
jgi:hypothetical protein